LRRGEFKKNAPIRAVLILENPGDSEERHGARYIFRRKSVFIPRESGPEEGAEVTSDRGLKVISDK
jgi:hypothetical protein